MNLNMKSVFPNSQQTNQIKDELPRTLELADEIKHQISASSNN